MKEYDLLVLGGGPGGYSLAVAAAKKGLSTALFEKERLGGTCLNVGCIPTKYLVDKANAMERVRALTEASIFRDAGAFSFRRIQAGKSAVSEKLVGGVRFLLNKSGAQVISGRAELKEGRVVVCDGQEYHGENVVIATGSEPLRIPIPGQEHCIDSTGALALTKLPQSIVVMGGGVIGLELACAFAAFGTRVTVVELLPRILPNEQPEAAALLLRAMEKRGVRFLTGAKLLRVEKTAEGLLAVCEKDGREERLPAEQVLMAAGRRVSLEGVDAAALGLPVDGKNCVVVDEWQRSALPGVYAIGDAAGGYQLAHAAYAEAETALCAILGESRQGKAPPVPVCTYTIPCLASVGLTTERAREAGFSPVLGSFSYDANGMALAEGASGAVFVVMDGEKQTTLGVTVVGENASELIAFAALAVRDSLTLADWKRLVVAHPSLCEMVREAALDAFHASVHKG